MVRLLICRGRQNELILRCAPKFIRPTSVSFWTTCRKMLSSGGGVLDSLCLCINTETHPTYPFLPLSCCSFLIISLIHNALNYTKQKCSPLPFSDLPLLLTPKLPLSKLESPLSQTVLPTCLDSTLRRFQLSSCGPLLLVPLCSGHWVLKALSRSSAVVPSVCKKLPTLSESS